MAAPDENDTTPSLEPPRLFGRRRTKDTDPEPRDAAADPAPDTVPDTVPAGRPTDGDTRVLADAEGGFVDVGADPVRPVDAPAPAPRPARTRRLSPTRLAVPSRAAAPLAGLLTGLVLLALVWLGARGCEAVRGFDSCGTGPGLLVLVVIFVLTVVVGRLLLGLLHAPEPAMTSFLAVGVTALVAVLVLGGLFESAWVIVVIPLLTAAAFAAASWVATLQVDVDD